MPKSKGEGERQNISIDAAKQAHLLHTETEQVFISASFAIGFENGVFGARGK